YLGAWLAGNGCVPVFNLMEDAATAEISRSQIWQWIRSPKGVLDDGRKVTAELFKRLLAEELPKVHAYLGETAYRAAKYEEGARHRQARMLPELFFRPAGETRLGSSGKRGMPWVTSRIAERARIATPL